jgi:hypothetical protein
MQAVLTRRDADPKGTVVNRFVLNRTAIRLSLPYPNCRRARARVPSFCSPASDSGSHSSSSSPFGSSTFSPLMHSFKLQHLHYKFQLTFPALIMAAQVSL